MSTGTHSPFRAKTNNSEGGDFERPPTGAHPAVLIGLLDLGTHEFVYNGKASKSRKLMFVWELTSEIDSKGQNFIVGQDWSWSLGKNAHLRPIIEGWLGRNLKDEEEVDFGAFLGAPCQITLVEGQTANGKKFTEISAVSRPMKNLNVQPATHDVFAFSLEDQDSSAVDPSFPEWVPLLYGKLAVDKVKASIEWQSLPGF